ncbi:uncharacterized protein LOC100574014 [Acyrthosiphon pisum]|uniref:Uncharacterized protein n=1 Tax=Acyrthosiphon pisum TaxID=7029 RepID=A0A8R2ABU6_ACYPI|nr:uncharacterized protein LOC100574014 [Acyrthosiphon pisum]|eukprot:XP_003247091.1 PREDICTED: uncharacterized protein LOC100574014 [Acyrthosiphon pisum]
MGDTSPDNDKPAADQPAAKQAATTLRPLIYSFRVAPVRGNIKQSALQLPFSVLFDNLIAVLWSMYNKETQIRSGINQIQWALEFLKCLKVDYNYPECIGKIVKILEKNMIELYSKINTIQYKAKQQEPSVEILDSKTDTEADKKTINEYALYFNEKDVEKKIAENVKEMDSVTGVTGKPSHTKIPRYIKELNALGKRKPKVEECENKSPQTFVIGALKKILKKSTDADTRTDVEELIKEINIQNKTPPATGDKTPPATSGDKKPPAAGDKKTPGAEDKTPPTAGETK